MFSDLNRLAATAILGLAVAMFAGGCFLGPGKTPPPRAYVDVDRSHDKKRLVVELGDAVRIVLPVAEGTGASWRVVGSNTYVLKQLAPPATRAGEASRSVAAGTEAVVFQAVNAGWSVVRLACTRGDESTVSPENTFEVTVNVVPQKAEEKRK